MSSMIRKRMFIALTGTELPAVLPINHGQPMNGKIYTMAGTVTDEHPHGVWFRLERLFEQEGHEMHRNPPTINEYFLPWSAFKRVTLIPEPETEPIPPPNTGMYL